MVTGARHAAPKALIEEEFGDGIMGEATST
jgi:cyanate lyase